MALVELRVEWVDSAAAKAPAPSSMFVRCTRQPVASSGKSFLRLELLCGPRMWRAEVHEKHKPVVLDCSAPAFLAALEAAFTPQETTLKSRFSFKWAAQKAQLTLSEHATPGLAMKYASVSFTAVDADDEEENWKRLLHDVVAQSERNLSETTRQKKRIRELEEMITKKDALLETALTAKQRLEDELFAKFCAVLNGKKEEIERLQREVAMASASATSKTAYKPKAAAKKRAAPPGAKKKAMGAKLTKKSTKKKVSDEDDEEEEDEEVGDEVEEDSDSGDESASANSSADEDDSPKKPRARSRVKRDAINAYSQLASQIPMSSQVCAAADVLDDLDAIMKTEVERDDEQAASTRTTRKRPPPAVTQRPQSPEKKVKTTIESSPVPTTTMKKEHSKPKPKPKTASPPRKPVDSEEEDILDMLS